ncbi:PQQ-binding-like beta-propeller repeat protein [Streptomyces cinnabarinus]|uniref:PQQ-binding-like beta-propeller repeat protein n=1 Tax=Streptomyces cinnabarinus TaxID=67287 RepID=A0ABY7KQR9_9ACTN|nr:PQQ-binding-like beta-propeller repeat protein [Streptomyces cinnabarinus]WAZ26908.1 PQQ-binding-like beta-propeller repeat protein [Streptomyces cinnabarinus]
MGWWQCSESLEPEDPRQVGRYRIVARLGVGGMGQVYLARSPGGYAFAVKVVRPDLARDGDFRRRFAREVSAARRVNGAFTAGVVDADPTGSPAWLATVYVPGLSLGEAIAYYGPWPARPVLALGAGLAEALEAIHAAGVVHRDLKPSNILLAADGPKVIDFGISLADEASALTQTGMTIGTPGFMSPEQLTGQLVGPASDVFALGAVLAYTATGTGPFGIGAAHALYYRAVHEPPNLAPLPPELRQVVAACLAKQPGQRPTVTALLGELTTAGGAGREPTAALAQLTGRDWMPGHIARLVREHASIPLPHTPPPARQTPPTAAQPDTTGPSPAPSGPSSLPPAEPPHPAQPASTGTAPESAVHQAHAQTAQRPPTAPSVTRPGGSTPAQQPAHSTQHPPHRHSPSPQTGPPPSEEGPLGGAARTAHSQRFKPGGPGDDEATAQPFTRPVHRSGISRRQALLGLAGTTATALGLATWTLLDDSSGGDAGKLLWKFPAGVVQSSFSPVVANGMVYIGNYDNNLYAVDTRTGQQRWKFSNGVTRDSGVKENVTETGSASSPCLADGLLYFGSWDYNLYAVDASTGKQRWKFLTSRDMDSSPCVVDGVVYIGNYDSNLYAVDADTGELRWKFPTDGGIFSSPVVADGLVYVGSRDKNLYALDADTGELRWKFPTDGWVESSPFRAYGMVYVGSTEDELHAVDTDTGQERWRFPVPQYLFPSSPVAADGAVYVGSNDKNLYALDASTGKQRWKFRTDGMVGSSPAVGNGVVYVGSDDKHLYAVDASTGKQRWKFRTDGTIESSPVVADGVVYFRSDDGNLYAVKT